MATKNSKTQLIYKIVSKFEIDNSNFNFQGNLEKTMRLSIYNLRL